jgi:hypothetical protein
MAFQPETAIWEAGVFQLETGTAVQGGVGGASNTPLLHLANRTLYLKQHVDALEAAASGYAPINSPVFTGTPTAPTAPLGDRTLKVANTTFVRDTVGGVTSKSVAGSSNVALTAVECGSGTLILTGVLTGNINVTVPDATPAKWVVANRTTGAFTITFKTVTGTGVVLGQGLNNEVFSDGTNVLQSKTDFPAVALTGASTAVTQGSNDNSTKVATTAYVDSAVAGATGVAAASETVAGKVELATAAETATGTDNTRAVHPAGLKSVTDTLAPLNSPGFTGNPTATTQAAGNNTTRLATTAFVQGEIAAISGVSQATTTVAGKVELATSGETSALTDTQRAVTPSSLATLIGTLAPKADPAFTGVPTAPTAAGGTNTTQLATTAFVATALASFSPSFADATETVKGKVELATAAETATGTDNTRAVHPAGLKSVTDTLAPLNSPGLTGAPTAPTPSASSNSTAIATTAWVNANVSLNYFAAATGAGTLAGVSLYESINASGSPTLFLATASDTKAGTIQAYQNIHASGTPLLSRQGTDTIRIGNTSVSSFTLGPGSTVILVCDGSSSWRVVGGSAGLSKSAEFKSSIGSSGYHKLPGGLLLQWTQVQVTNPANSVTATFPLAFGSSTGVTVCSQALNGNASAVQAWHHTPTASNVAVWADTAVFVDVIAVGPAP